MPGDGNRKASALTVPFTEFTFRSARIGRQAVLPYPFALAKRGLRHGEAMRRRAGRPISGASTSWPSHRGRAKGNRVGIADPIAIVLRMAATPSVVAYGQICKRAE